MLTPTGEQTYLEKVSGRLVRYRGRELLYFGGGDYHGYADHLQVRAATTASLARYGLSTSASRATTGNHPLYEDCERAFAAFAGSPSCTLCPSGYLANQIMISALAERYDVFLVDAQAHASIQDAVRLAGKEVVVYRRFDPQSLLSVGRRRPRGRALVCTEAVDGIVGDVAPVGALAAVATELDATLHLDEAHSLGVMGETGRGSLEYWDVPSSRQEIVRSGSLAKAFGSFGGLVFGSPELCQRARGVPASMAASPPPLPYVAAAVRSLQLLCVEPQGARVLAQRARSVKSTLRDNGFDIAVNDFPVVSLRTSHPDEVATRLLKREIFPSLVSYPGVSGRLFRFAIQSCHSDEEVSLLVTALCEDA